jgi:hypothetical protein
LPIDGGGGGGGMPMVVVAAAVVLAMRQQSKQRQRQQHDNNTTINTATQDSQHAGGIIEWQERNCVRKCVFSGVSRYVSTP